MQTTSVYIVVFFMFSVLPNTNTLPERDKNIYKVHVVTKDIVNKMIPMPTKGDNFWECESRLYTVKG